MFILGQVLVPEVEDHEWPHVYNPGLHWKRGEKAGSWIKDHLSFKCHAGLVVSPADQVGSIISI